MQQIHNLHHLALVLDQGPYAWPGGYPKYFVMADGEVCSFEAIADNKAEVYAAAPGCLDEERSRDTQARSPDPQWWPVAVEINWEDQDLVCAHTGKPIEAAYA